MMRWMRLAAFTFGSGFFGRQSRWMQEGGTGVPSGVMVRTTPVAAWFHAEREVPEAPSGDEGLLRPAMHGSGSAQLAQDARRSQDRRAFLCPQRCASSLAKQSELSDPT